MAVGYTRQSAGLIAANNVIAASHFNNEYDQLVSAFNASTGHDHNGTVGGGAKIILTSSVTGILPVANGGTNAATAGAARTSLGLVIGTDVQAWDTNLDQLAAMAPTDDLFIIGQTSGATWVIKTPSEVRTILGLSAGGGGDIWVERAGDTMSGDLNIDKATPVMSLDASGSTDAEYILENDGVKRGSFLWDDSENNVYVRSHSGVGAVINALKITQTTDIMELNGNQVLLNTDLGVSVQDWDQNLDQLAVLAPTDNDFIFGSGSSWIKGTNAQARTALGLVSGGTGDIWVDVAGDSMTGDLTISKATPVLILNGSGVTDSIAQFQNDDVIRGQLYWDDSLSELRLDAHNSGGSRVNGLEVTQTPGLVEIEGNQIWHSGNDGPTSGLGAQYLGSQDSAYHLAFTNHTGTIATGQYGDDTVTVGKMEHGTQGGFIIYSAGGAPTKFGAGAVGQTPRSNGAGADITWEDGIELTSEVNTTSGTSVVIKDSGISSWVKKITMLFEGVSLNGTEYFVVQLGDSVGYETSGYVSTAFSSVGSAEISPTDGFGVYVDGNTDAFTGTVTLYLKDATNNTWIAEHTGRANAIGVLTGGGSKSLSDPLTRIRIRSENVSTFDGGSIALLLE